MLSSNRQFAGHRLNKTLMVSSALALVFVLNSLRAKAQTEPAKSEQPTSLAPPVPDKNTVKPDVIGEIVVTANRRQEKLQKVGIAVTAISGDALAARGISDTSDLGALTPSLIVSEAGGSELSGLVSIRGVSQNDFTGQIESPNAFYIDDYYQPAASSAVQQLFDIKRVEILKGPQGTLFGRNATGGLLNVFTNDPSKDLSGYAQASFGNYNDYNLQAAVSDSLSDTVTARLALFRHSHGPYYKNLLPGGPDLNSDNTFALRGKIHIAASENLKIKLGFDYYLSDYKNTGGSGEVPAAVDPVTGLGFDLPINTPFALAPKFIQTAGPFQTSATAPSAYYRQTYGVSANINYDFGGFQLASLSNYSSVETSYLEDNDQTPFNIGTFGQDSRSKHFTQEFRLYGDNGGFRWNTGLYFLYINGTYGNRFNFIAADADLSTVYTIKTKSYSGFAQVSKDFTDQFTFTLGGRIVHDDRDYLYNWSCLGLPTNGCAAFGGPGTIGGAARNGPLTNKHGETGWAGRAQLDFKPTNNILLYASVNRGYKGFNYNANFAGNVPLSDLILKGEKLLAYEVGTKITFLGGKVRFNTAGYIYNYKDFHAYDQRGLNFTLFNSDAKISGWEGDVTVRPWRGLTLTGGYNYIFRADVFNVPIAKLKLTRRAAQTPTFTGNLSVEQVVDTSIGAFTGLINLTHKSSSYSYLSNAPNTLIDKGELVNVNLAYVPNRYKNLEISAYCTNLTKNYKPTYKFDLAVAGYTEQDYGTPRQFGLQAKVSF